VTLPWTCETAAPLRRGSCRHKTATPTSGGRRPHGFLSAVRRPAHSRPPIGVMRRHVGFDVGAASVAAAVLSEAIVAAETTFAVAEAEAVRVATAKPSEDNHQCGQVANPIISLFSVKPNTNNYYVKVTIIYDDRLALVYHDHEP